MSNMSYCRFQNTALDLDDCADALEELLNADREALSADELRAAKRLVELCFSIVTMVADSSEYEVDEFMERFDSDKIVAAVLDEANADAARRTKEEDE